LPTLEDIKLGALLRGLDPAGIAEVVQVARFGADALNSVFRLEGRVGERLVYRGKETSFEFFEAGRTYAFNADGALLRLASEACCIRLAPLFRPQSGRQRLADRGAPTSDHGRLRRDAASPAPAILAGGRSRRRQGDPARLHQGDRRLREARRADRHAVEEPHPHVRPPRQSANAQSLQMRGRVEEYERLTGAIRKSTKRDKPENRDN
jgi:hypothetical protein